MLEHSVAIESKTKQQEPTTRVHGCYELLHSRTTTPRTKSVNSKELFRATRAQSPPVQNPRSAYVADSQRTPQRQDQKHAYECLCAPAILVAHGALERKRLLKAQEINSACQE